MLHRRHPVACKLEHAGAPRDPGNLQSVKLSCARPADMQTGDPDFKLLDKKCTRAGVTPMDSESGAPHQLAAHCWWERCNRC